VFVYKVYQAILKKLSDYGYPVPEGVSFSHRELMRLVRRTSTGGKNSKELVRVLNQFKHTAINMNNLSELNKTTDKFFILQWPSSGTFGKRPTWERWATFPLGSAPYYTLGGCYALFEGENLIYIGKGASKGRGKTPYHGIARRLQSHVLRAGNHGYTLIEEWGQAAQWAW
jgi:hypothetical protein